jgi:hypothetical protein
VDGLNTLDGRGGRIFLVVTKWVTALWHLSLIDCPATGMPALVFGAKEFRVETYLRIMESTGCHGGYLFYSQYGRNTT